MGIGLGGRVLRVHDVEGTRRVRDAMAAVLDPALARLRTGATLRAQGHDRALQTPRRWRSSSAATTRLWSPRPCRDVVAELVGDRDPGMVVEEHTELGSEAVDVGVIVDALSTPPFLTDRRVVVVRDAGGISSSEAGRIAAALADPVPGVVLVVAAGGGTLATVLANAITKSGQVIDTKVGTGRARTQWLAGRLKDSPVKLDSEAAARLGEHLGDDLGRLDGLFDSLASAYGESATDLVRGPRAVLRLCRGSGSLGPHRCFGCRGLCRIASCSGTVVDAFRERASRRPRDVEPSLRVDAAPRRLGGDEPERGRRSPRGAKRVRREEGARAIAPTRVRAHRPGDHSARARPTST